MRRARSFFAFLFILLIAGAAVFYLGYSPLKIPHGSAGVIISKTNGVSEVPVERGVFQWNWQFLIPKNTELRIFSIKPYKYSKFVKEILPSGDVYSKILKENPDFTYSFDFDVEFKFTARECVNLVKTSEITDDSDLQNKLKIKADEICTEYINLFSDHLKNEDEKTDSQKIIETLVSKYSDSGLEITSLNITNVKFPDMKLYKKAQEIYFNYLSEVETKLNSMADSQARDISEYAKNLNKLEQFGKVLHDHPELADFLKQSKDLNETLKTINSIR
ncbi:MAG: hypothetical protein KBT21_11565 [Treponema sp.]|nr:hypothetical protein [Candidatus Treponema merdequi]